MLAGAKVCHEERRNKRRIVPREHGSVEAFSDGVIAVAIRLLVRDIKVPVRPEPPITLVELLDFADLWSEPRPPARDLCPDTGRARLGYDLARILLDRHTGSDLHQLRHSAATHLGEKNVELQTIMAKTRHRNPRSAMRYIKPGAEAVADATDLTNLGRGHG